MTREVIPIPLDDLEEVYQAVEVARRNDPSTVMEVALKAAVRVAGWSRARRLYLGLHGGDLGGGNIIWLTTKP